MLRWVWVWLLVPGATLAETWSLERVLSRAREAAPEVQLAARLVGEAEASAVGAGVPFPVNPRLFGDYRGLASGPPQEPFHGYLVGVNGEVEVGGAWASRMTEARRRAELARAELEAERLRAAARAWNAYVEVWVAGQRVATVEEALRLEQRIERAVQEQIQVGVAAEPDRAVVQVELASLAVQLEEARRQLEEARMGLRQVLDLPASEPLQVAGDMSDPGEVPEVGTLVRRAVERRPELAALKARLSLLEATRERLAREALPKVGLNAGYDAQPASPAFGFIGLQVELPVAQRNQGPRAVAAAQSATEQLRLETELRRVEREVALAHQQYLTRRRQLSTLATQAVPAAERNEDLLEEGWRSGRYDIFRLTQATRELLRVRLQSLETLRSAWSDRVELERTSGGLTP